MGSNRKNITGASPFHSRVPFLYTGEHLNHLSETPQPDTVFNFSGFFFLRWAILWMIKELFEFCLRVLAIGKVTTARVRLCITVRDFLFCGALCPRFEKGSKNKTWATCQQSLHIKHTLSCCLLVFVYPFWKIYIDMLNIEKLPICSVFLNIYCCHINFNVVSVILHNAWIVSVIKCTYFQFDLNRYCIWDCPIIIKMDLRTVSSQFR